MSSISSQIVSHITSFRNPNGTEYEWLRWSINTRDPVNPLKVAIAEVGYLFTVPFSIIEAALSVIAKIFSSCLPIGQERHRAMSQWMHSSTFSVAWSLGSSVINVLVNDMIATESNAKKLVKAAVRNLFVIPVSLLQDIRSEIISRQVPISN